MAFEPDTAILWVASSPTMSGTFTGRTFGDFVVREPIGHGGAGEVYRAEQLALGREAVIKVLLNQRSDTTIIGDRFLREARLASRLDHPFAAHVYAFGQEADGVLWIAMELVRGTPLDSLLKKQGPIPLPRFVPFFERLCEVVNAAHEQRIIHRDIKPANVMVIQRAGRLLPKLLDLGIARTQTVTEETEQTAGRPSPSPSHDSGIHDAEHGSGDLLTQADSMVLTQVGNVVGTPHYMAPEQWADASSADARADLYSLGILAYQCLTGALPFAGKSLRTLAIAHATKPLPSLPETLPAALHEVLVKATAKNADNRYSSAMELASSLRAAAALEQETEALPQLDAATRDNALAEAPQPIAEAVALLDSARLPAHGAAAIEAITTTMVRYLAMMALASRLRIGSGAAREDPRVLELLQLLTREGLSNAEWLSLTKALLKPFSNRREAHPVPELVRFFDETSNASSSGAASLDALVALELPHQDPAAVGRAAMNYVYRGMPLVSKALEAASFIFDYALVVQKQTPERWMGTRRSSRITEPLAGSPLEQNDVVLVDHIGLAVLHLGPFIQLIAPGGGAAEELFLLDGPGRHGARLVALPSGLERHDAALWSKLTAAGFDVEPSAADADTTRTPYLGLSSFRAADAENYFGREEESEAFANRLRRERFLAVVGPSGTGKSSFVVAGVVPLLPKSWRVVMTRPGTSPLQALNARLAAEGLAAPGPELPAKAAAQLVAQSIEPGSTLVLVIDQFEELVTLCQDAALREAFAARLMAIADHPSQSLRVVLTLRDDFLIRVLQLTSFRDRLSNALQLLGTPAEADLLRVVTEPARRVGYGFDDPALPTLMVKAVADTPAALALLSFTASQLWELRDRHLRLMRIKTYEALGGVGGALAHHAEATMASFDGPDQAVVRELFRHLVTAQGTRSTLSRQEALEVSGSAATVQPVLEKLLVARLLVSSETASGDDQIEIVHEALIVAWPRLVAWQREDADSARLRDSLRASARQWAERNRPSGLLWRKETLTEYRLWRARYPGRLTQLEDAFATASLREERRAQMLRRSLAIGAFVSLAIGLVVVLRAYAQADSSLKKSEVSETAAKASVQHLWFEQARLAMNAEQPMAAFVYANAAAKAGVEGAALDHLVGVAAQKLEGAGASSKPLNGGVLHFLVDPNERFIVAQTTAEVASLTLPNLELIHRWPFHCQGAVLLPDRRHLALGCVDRALRIVDLVTNDVTTVAVPFGLYSVALSPDGKGLVVAGDGGKISLRDLRGAEIKTFEAARAPVLEVASAPTGQTLVFNGLSMPDPGSFNGLSAYRADTLLWHFERREPVQLVASAAGDRVLFGTAGGTVGAVSGGSGKQLWATSAHAGAVRGLRVSKDGRTAVSVANDGTVKQWRTSDGALLFQAFVAVGTNRCGDVLDADSLVTAVNGVIQRISLQNGAVEFSHHGHTVSIAQCRVLATRGLIVTADANGVVRTWDASVSSATRNFDMESAQGLDNNIVIRGNQAFALLRSGEATPIQIAVPPFSTFASAIAPDESWGVIAFDDVFIRLTREGSKFVAGERVMAGERLEEYASASPNSKFIVLPTHEHGIWVIEKTAAPRNFSPAHEVFLNSVANDTTVSLASTSGTLYEMDLTNGAIVNRAQVHAGSFYVWPSHSPRTILSYGLDGKLVTVTTPGLTTGATLDSEDEFTALPIIESDSNGLVAIFSTSGAVGVYDLQTNRKLSQRSLPTAIVQLRETKHAVLIRGSDGHISRFVTFPKPPAVTRREQLKCRVSVELVNDSVVKKTTPCTAVTQ